MTIRRTCLAAPRALSAGLRARHSGTAVAAPPPPPTCSRQSPAPSKAAPSQHTHQLHTIASSSRLPPLQSGRSHARHASNDASSSKYERRDEAIRAKRVRLVDPETGKLNETAESTKSLLQRIDRQNWWLVQVTEGGREEDETGARLRVADEDTPIVKLVNRKQIYERAKEKKALKKSDPGAAARSETLEKTVQITWSSTPHDVKHKLLGGKTHLWRKRVGARVVVAITSKRGKGPAGGSTPESRLKLIEEVTDLLCAPPEPNEIGRHELVQEAHVKQKGQLEWRMNGAAVDITFELASGKAK